MTVVHALRLLEHVESQLADLYQLFADRFVGESQLAALFARMARDEKRNALATAYQRRVLKQNPKLIKGLTLDTHPLEQASAHVRELTGRALEMTPGEATSAALELERTSKHRFILAMHTVEEPFASFLARELRADPGNWRRLQQFLDADAQAPEPPPPPGFQLVPDRVVRRRTGSQPGHAGAY